MSRYQAVLFDWDGTLVDNLEIWMSAVMRVFERYDLAPERRKIAELFGSFHQITTLGVPENELPSFLTLIDDEVAKGLASVLLVPGADSLLRQLQSAGISSAVVTTGTWQHFGSAFRLNRCEQWFDVVVTGADVTRHKPHSEPLELALAQLGVGPENAVMVGDSTKDLGAAVAAGVDSVLYYPDHHRDFYDLETLLSYRPTHVCRTFDEMRKILLPQGTLSSCPHCG